MDFLGLGPLEILLILIVGFLFFGPEKLPGMAAKAGEWYRKLTKTTSTLTKSLTEEVSAESKSRQGINGSETRINRPKSGLGSAPSEIPGPPVQEAPPGKVKTDSISGEKTGK